MSRCSTAMSTGTRARMWRQQRSHRLGTQGWSIALRKQPSPSKVNGAAESDCYRFSVGPRPSASTPLPLHRPLLPQWRTSIGCTTLRGTTFGSAFFLIRCSYKPSSSSQLLHTVIFRFVHRFSSTSAKGKQAEAAINLVDSSEVFAAASACESLSAHARQIWTRWVGWVFQIEFLQT